MIATEIDESGLRWFFTPDAQMHGLQGTSGGSNFNYHHSSFPAYGAASSPTCSSTAYATGKDHYSMVVDFFDDATGEERGLRTGQPLNQRHRLGWAEGLGRHLLEVPFDLRVTRGLRDGFG